MQNNHADPEALRTLMVYADHLHPNNHGRAEAANVLFKELEAAGARAGYCVEPHPNEPENVRYVKIGKMTAVVSFAHGQFFIGQGNDATELPLVFNPAASPQQFEGPDPERAPAIRVLCQAIVDFMKANEPSRHRYAQSGGTSEWASSPF